jgi:hypothetical protein
MEEKLKLGEIKIGGKITVESISVNILEVAGKRNYECQLTLDVLMIWNDEIENKHISKLRWNLKDTEVQQLQEKGLIKTKLVVENL